MTTVPTDPDSGSTPATSPAVRRPFARACARRSSAAWARRSKPGALPAVPPRRRLAGGRDRARPAKAEHGDLATNLAMKLARPLRRPPLAIAEAIVAALGGDDAADRRRSDRVGGGGPARVHQPPPRGSRARGDRRRDPRVARDVGPGRADPAAERQRRVRLGQPDRPADDRQRARRVHRRPALPDPRGRRPDGHARVLLQRFRRPDRQAGRVGRRAPARRGGAGGRLPRRLRRRPRGRAPGRRLGGGDRRGRRRRRGRRALGGRPGPGGDRGEPRAARRPLRRLEERGLAPRRGLGGPGDRAPAGGRPPLRAGRRAVVPLDRVRRRQGPRRDPLERRADLLRGGHRLRDREVQPRLRPPDLHLGRRPPRDGGPAAERRRGDGLRPRRGPGAALRLGPVHLRGRRGLDVEAGRRVRDARRAAGRGRRRRGPLVVRVTRRRRPRSTSTSSSRRSSRPRTRSSTSSTPTPGSRRSCARPPSPA